MQMQLKHQLASSLFILYLWLHSSLIQIIILHGVHCHHYLDLNNETGVIVTNEIIDMKYSRKEMFRLDADGKTMRYKWK